MTTTKPKKISKAVEQYADILKSLHNNWTPHKGQILIGKAIFVDKKTRVFVQCGRKFGKSEIAIYCLVRWALTNPNSDCYYIGPLRKQTLAIAWDRLLRFIPKKYIESHSNVQAIIKLKNGSKITMDGSDNVENHRGLTPSFVVFDEFKDFKKKYYEAMEPNLAALDAPLFVIGTPPDKEGQYTELAEECKTNEFDDSLFIQRTSYDNPHVKRDTLNKIKHKLIARGDEDVWQREYLAQFVRGGNSSIFPMFDKEKHIQKYTQLYRMQIRRDESKLEWYSFADPGTTTVFGWLFVAINPYTKDVFVMDEIYATRTLETSVGLVWPTAEAKMKELRHSTDPEGFGWFRGYDQAAAWFANEMAVNHNVAFMPTDKSKSKKEDGISLIKDLMLTNKLHISDRCNKLAWEIENYVKDDNGNIPKKDDHLIDCLRYVLHAANYSLLNELEPRKEESNRRGYSLEEDLDWD